MTTTTIILLAVYVIGLLVTLLIVKKWENPVIEKIFYVAFWPLTLLLYLIHKIHESL